LSIRRVCVFLPCSIAFTMSVEKRIGISFIYEYFKENKFIATGKTLEKVITRMAYICFTN
jgi:hypothetical protein